MLTSSTIPRGLISALIQPHLFCLTQFGGGAAPNSMDAYESMRFLKTRAAKPEKLHKAEASKGQRSFERWIVNLGVVPEFL